LRFQARFTGGFCAIAIGARLELAENQWVVVLQQLYYTRELQMTARLKNPLGKVVGTRRLRFRWRLRVDDRDRGRARIAEWLLTMIERRLLT
jgi:hypothetical protein